MKGGHELSMYTHHSRTVPLLRTLSATIIEHPRDSKTEELLLRYTRQVFLNYHLLVTHLKEVKKITYASGKSPSADG